MIITIFSVVAMLGARLLVNPIFIHANFHGMGLLNNGLSFPAPAWYRSEFGQGSFLIPGLFEWALGWGWRGMAAVNCIANVGIVGVAAVLSRRVAGDLAGYATLAAGAVMPLMVRVAASEDSHNIACFFGLLAISQADLLMRTKKLNPIGIIAFVASTWIAFYSRQSLFFWPFLGLTLLFTTLRNASAKRRLLIGLTGLVLVLGLGFGFVSLFSRTNNILSVRGLIECLVIDISLLGEFLINHPLLCLKESLLFSTMSVVGIWHGVRHRDTLLIVLILGAGAAFLSTLALSLHPGFGVQYGFRLPLVTLLLPLVGVGVAFLKSQLIKRFDSKSIPSWGTSVIILGLLLLPIIRLVDVLESPEPLSAQYEIIRDNIAQIPPGSTLYFVDSQRDSSPRYSLTADLRATPNLEVLHWPGSCEADTQRVFILEGIECYAYSLIEQLPQGDPAVLIKRMMSTPQGMTDASRAFWTDQEAIFSLVGLERPHGIRPECRQFQQLAVRKHPWGEINIATQELPHIYYSKTQIPIGLWEIDRTQCAPLQEK